MNAGRFIETSVSFICAFANIVDYVFQFTCWRVKNAQLGIIHSQLQIADYGLAIVEVNASFLHGHFRAVGQSLLAEDDDAGAGSEAVNNLHLMILLQAEPHIDTFGNAVFFNKNKI